MIIISAERHSLLDKGLPQGQSTPRLPVLCCPHLSVFCDLKQVVVDPYCDGPGYKASTGTWLPFEHFPAPTAVSSASYVLCVKTLSEK